MAFSVMTLIATSLSVMTLGKLAKGIMAFSLMTLIKTTNNATLS